MRQPCWLCKMPIEARIAGLRDLVRPVVRSQGDNHQLRAKLLAEVLCYGVSGYPRQPYVDNCPSRAPARCKLDRTFSVMADFHLAGGLK